MNVVFKVDEIERSSAKVKPLSDLDPRMPKEETRGQPVEDLVPFGLDPEHPERTVLLGSRLRPELRGEIEQFLREYRDVFAWSHEDMLGIDPAVISHQLRATRSTSP